MEKNTVRAMFAENMARMLPSPHYPMHDHEAALKYMQSLPGTEGQVNFHLSIQSVSRHVRYS